MDIFDLIRKDHRQIENLFQKLRGLAKLKNYMNTSINFTKK